MENDDFQLYENMWFFQIGFITQIKSVRKKKKWVNYVYI